MRTLHKSRVKLHLAKYKKRKIRSFKAIMHRIRLDVRLNREKRSVL